MEGVDSEATDSAEEFSEDETSDDAPFDFQAALLDVQGTLDEEREDGDKRAHNLNGGLDNFNGGTWDKEYWDAVVDPSTPAFVGLFDKKFGGQYVFHRSRVNKAMRFMKHSSAASVFASNSTVGKSKLCRCKRGCTKHIWTTESILRIRNQYFQQSSEAAATKWLADQQRPHNSRLASTAPRTKVGTPAPPPSFVWKVFDRQVCGAFFQAVYGISEDKMKGVRELLRNPHRTVQAPRVSHERSAVKFNQCKAFWKKFFDECCQKPNDKVRLFPENLSYRTIYEDIFTPWYARTLPHLVGEILGYFQSARRDPDFKDVQERAKHFHNRCLDCANLQARRLRAFKQPRLAEDFKRDWAVHQAERRGWRFCEDGTVLSAKHNPGEEQVFWFDDTESFGFPRFTKRPHKNLTTSRFEVIPFLLADLGRNKEYYIYTAKNRFKKGANRLCTTLMGAIRAAKQSSHESRFARKLTLIADNYSENKNNTLFAFCSDLVSRGWYDEILLLYGPPGHTHNGGDAQHNIHNNICGNFTSPTLAHFLARYPQSWRFEARRPDPCILDVQYDFVEFYAKYTNKIAGFTKTESDPGMVRGFQIMRGANGIINVKYKPKAESGDWLGANGRAGSEGFTVLKGRPVGMPGVVPPSRHVMEKKYYNQLMGSRMEQCLKDAGEPEARAWLKKAAKHGVIPHTRIQGRGERTPGNIGSLVKLTCGDVNAEAQIIEDADDDQDTFWALPEAVQSQLDARKLLNASTNQSKGPAVGYQKVPVEKRPTYAGSTAEEARARRRKADTASDSSDDSGSSSDSSESESPNPPKRKGQPVNTQRPKKRRRRVQKEPEEEVTFEFHNVLAILAENESKMPELWLAIPLLRGASSGKQVRVQFLEEIISLGDTRDESEEEKHDTGDTYYQLTTATGKFTIEHTFEKVKFKKTITYTRARTHTHTHT